MAAGLLAAAEGALVAEVHPVVEEHLRTAASAWLLTHPQ